MHTYEPATETDWYVALTDQMDELLTAQAKLTARAWVYRTEEFRRSSNLAERSRWHRRAHWERKAWIRIGKAHDRVLAERSRRAEEWRANQRRLLNLAPSQ